MPFPDSAFGRATPGPWHANADCIEAAGPEGPRDVTVAVVTGYPKGDSNARLIAAAPELLAALKQCLPLIDPHLAAWDDGKDCIAAVRSAIAKAEGTDEQPGPMD